MKRLVFVISGILLSLPLVLITQPLQSDTRPSSCEVSVECIGRLPYYEPLVLINPVAGADESSILSIWGDDRDLGKRKHQGMDIFAPRGTRVIAPTDGIITKVGWNPLGGRVVWLSSRRLQHSFYFAHLKDVNVCKGDTVLQGHLLGTVGNTGNARFTPPHLHFGIYYLNTRKAMNRQIVWREDPGKRLPESLLASAW